MADGYDTAQICLSGHIVNDSASEYPHHNETFCSKCGQETITNCPGCNTSIRGYYRVDSVLSIGDKVALPLYCHACGKAYPWTTSKLELANELVEELEGLSGEDKIILKKSLPEITRDNPQTTMAISRVKRIASKLSAASGQLLLKVTTEIATELAKKQLGL
jgi:hypothetical protein